MRIVAALCSLLLIGPVLAASPDGATNKERAAQNPCHEDMQKFCGSVEKGGGRVKKCIEENRKNFSPDCQKDMARRHEGAASKRQACAADAKRLCPGVQAGGGRIIACLKEHERELSPACRDAVPARPPAKPTR